jgi:hypothetical protein
MGRDMRRKEIARDRGEGKDVVRMRWDGIIYLSPGRHGHRSLSGKSPGHAKRDVLAWLTRSCGASDSNSSRIDSDCMSGAEEGARICPRAVIMPGADGRSDHAKIHQGPDSYPRSMLCSSNTAA